jgi:thiol-disulfide isomerase/thioredoxin
MIKKLLLPVIAIASGLAIWSVLAQKSSEIPTAPPLTGWMQNFTPTVPAGPALEGKLLAEDGKVASLSDFRGKLVLVNFWATWCLPCIREMPSLLRLQKKRGGDDFIVLALAQDFNGWKMVAPFLQRRDFPVGPNSRPARDHATRSGRKDPWPPCRHCRMGQRGSGGADRLLREAKEGAARRSQGGNK